MIDSPPDSSSPVVELHQVTRTFGKKTALCDVTLEIPRGGVFGLIGGNGAGKTTIIKHLLGLLRPQIGTVKVFGLDPIQHPVETLGRIGYLSEERDLPEWMRVGELMSYTQAFFPRWDQGFALELCSMFDLDQMARIKTLSRGQRARAGLLVALAHRPDLLVLDEPSSGLDPVVRRDILSAIIRTIAEEGRTVLFSSHLLDEVERVADRVAIIHNGRVILQSSMDEIKSQHHRLTCRFEQSFLQPPNLAGVLSSEGGGHEWTFVCSGRRSEFERSASEFGGVIVDVAPLSLDEIFVSRVLK